MSKKIEAAVFANYVQGCNEALENILNTKQIETRNNPLITNIEKVGRLINPNHDTNLDTYILDSYFQKMIKEYEEDPLLEMNGGIYKGCVYYIFNTINDSVALYNLGYTVYSDGEISTETSNRSILIEHIWDKTKDVDKLDDGTIVRWVKLYSKSIPSSSYYIANGQPHSSRTSTDISGVVFVINDLSTIAACGNSAMGHGYFKRTLTPHLRGIVIGKRVTQSSQMVYISASGYAFWDIPSLEYIKIYNTISWTTGCRLIQGCNNLKKLDFKIKNGAWGQNGTLIGDCKANVFIPADFVTGESNSTGTVFDKYYGDVMPNIPLDAPFSRSSSLSSGLGETYFGEIYCAETTFPMRSINTTHPTETILAYSGPNIKNIIVPKDFSYSIYIPNLPKLTLESLTSLFNNLADMTNSDTRILKFSSYQYIPKKLVDIAVNKNWTVTGAIIYE